MTPHIRNWKLIGEDGLESAPEKYDGCIASGYIYGSPRFLDGEYVFTSRIVKIEGFKIHTQSGSTYVLAGPPDIEGEDPNQPSLAGSFPAIKNLYQRKKNDREEH